MAERKTKKTARNGVRKQKIFLHASSLASVESLSVQEIVISADIQCVECQKKLANILSKMNDAESVVVNVLNKTVVLTRRLQLHAGADSPRKIAIVKRLFSFAFG